MSAAASDPVHRDVSVAGLTHRGPVGRWLPAVAAPLIFLTCAIPLIVTQHDRSRGRFDQINYHQPAVLRFAESLPFPDLSDSLTATTPGYHLVLAVVARSVSDGAVVLQAAGAMITAALLALLAWTASRTTGPVMATLLTFTLASSLYVFSAGVFLLPDNAAWLGVLAVLLLSLGRGGTRMYVAAGAVFTALVMTRQSHAWAAAPIWAAALVGTSSRPDAMNPRAVLGRVPTRIVPIALAIVATLPGFVLLAAFARLWGGLAPPFFQGVVQGANPAVPAIILTQFAIIGVFHVGFWGPGVIGFIRSGPRPALLLFLAAGVAGLAASVLPETTYSVEAGRWSGVWNVVDHVPQLFGRTSPVVVLGSVGGAWVLVAWLVSITARDRWIWLAAIAGFIAASTVNHNAWPRYHEPFVLLIAAMLSARSGKVCPRPDHDLVDPTGSNRLWSVAGSVARVAGLVALCVFLTTVTVSKFRGGAGAVVQRTQPEFERPLTDLWPESWLENGPPAAFRPRASDPAGQ